jgi:two-component system response regulator PilR (NtrC family)
VVVAERSLPQQLLVNRIPCLTADCTIPDAGMMLEPLLEELEKKYLLKALEKTGGAKKKAGELLGMSFRSFRYRLAKFGLDSGEE